MSDKLRLKCLDAFRLRFLSVTLADLIAIITRE
jgi:hypothetical protein